jgi:hypothetical protein
VKNLKIFDIFDFPERQKDIKGCVYNSKMANISALLAGVTALW